MRLLAIALPESDRTGIRGMENSDFQPRRATSGEFGNSIYG